MPTIIGGYLCSAVLDDGEHRTTVGGPMPNMTYAEALAHIASCVAAFQDDNPGYKPVQTVVTPIHECAS